MAPVLKKKKKKKTRGTFVNAFFSFFFLEGGRRGERNRCLISGPVDGSWKVSPRPDSIAINFGYIAQFALLDDSWFTIGMKPAVTPFPENQNPKELPRKRLSLYDLVNLTWQFMTMRILLIEEYLFSKEILMDLRLIWKLVEKKILNRNY